MGENRYTNLKRQFPEQAEALFKKTRSDTEIRYNNYKKLTQVSGTFVGGVKNSL